MHWIAVPTPSSWQICEQVSGGYSTSYYCDGFAYLSDLLSKNLGPHDHPLAVHCFPQRPAENTNVDFLQTYSDSQIFDPTTVEELISKERLDDRR